jgi:hypothetical protein
MSHRMNGVNRNERQEPQLSLAQRDLAEGRWRGVWFYAMTAMRERYGPDAGKPPTPGTGRRREQSPPTA